MGCTPPLDLGRLRRPSTTRETGSLGSVRGRQELVKCQKDGRDGSISFAASDQKSRRDENSFASVKGGIEGFAASDQKSRRNECFLCECGKLDELRAPSGSAAAPGLLTECRGRSHLPPDVSLLIPSSSQSVAGRAFEDQGKTQLTMLLAVAPGLVNECRGRGTPARFQGVEAAQPVTSRQVECGKTENRPSHQSTAPHSRRSTRNTNISPHVVSVPRYRRRSMGSVAVLAPTRPSLWVCTL